MNKRNIVVSIMLALALLCFSAPFIGGKTVFAQDTAVVTEAALEGQLTTEDLQSLNDGKAEIFEHNGRVTFISGTCTPDAVKDMKDAEKVVSSMIGLLGGDAKTRFEPWRSLTDAAGNHYYVFQQMYANTTVLGGAVKVITTPDGKMVGLTSSIETELPDVVETEGISAEEAEKLVLQHAEETNQPELVLQEGLTSKMILPVVLTLDIESDDEEDGARFVWVVYTDNPAIRHSSTADLPYLAHYVTLDGEYLYNLATIRPGDTAGESGFDAAYIFEFMEPVDYTGYVDLSDGSEMELTVTVMRDKRTGMYYLGNIERKIVVADSYEFLYNNGHVVLASSPDNLEWDQVGLLSLYNYCKVYDYYKEIGWIGGDGLGTPIMILNDICDQKHNRIDNAVFIGNYLGWSLFGASLANDFSQALDVIAHEFTHCVTGSVMTYNSYLNDYGAINEAISDIQGKICDLMYRDEEDVDWIMGDKTMTPIRSMSDPHVFGQPEFTWDLHYVPAVKSPTAINDQGGVHTNSSLLNNIAYRLVADGGMSLEEARAFWFAVDCSMVPGTDYPQLRELLPWVLNTLGMEQYQTSLQRAIDAVRLGYDSMPDFFDDDRALLTLTLPDNENFTDDNWAIQVFSVDVQGLVARVKELFEEFSEGDYSSLPESLQKLILEESEPEEIVVPEEEPGFWDIFMDSLTGTLESFTAEEEPVEEPVEEPAEEPVDEYSEEEKELYQWLRSELENYIYSGMGAAGQDGRTIRIVTRPGRTIPLLMHMVFEGLSTIPDQVVFGIYINDKWYVMDNVDFTGLMDPEAENTETQKDYSELMEEPLVQDIIENVKKNFWNIRSFEDVLDLFTYNIKGGEINELSTNGLEDVVLPEPSETTEDDDEPVELPEPGKKSRPKLD